MARWRKQPNVKGLAGVYQSPRGLELREKEKVIIRVSCAFKGFSRDILGWYWYGLGRNTYNENLIFLTKEDAAKHASEYYKQHKKETKCQT